MNQQLQLLDRAYAEPIDVNDQITRFPPVSAPCPCQHDPCKALFPFCKPDEGDEE